MKKKIFLILLFLNLITVTAYAEISFNSVAEAKIKLKPFFQKYGIKLMIGNFTSSSYAERYANWNSVTDFDVKELQTYVNLFIVEWSKYPVKWIKKSKLTGIAIVKDLVVMNQKRYAMPDHEANVLYYDIGYGQYGTLYQRECLHHEFFHIIDYNYSQDAYFNAEGWKALNKKGFSYGSGGATAYDDKNAYYSKQREYGFVSVYATYAVEEDKADTYAYLMTNERFWELMELIKKDKIVAKKVGYMLNFIKELAPAMDEVYFEKINSN